MESSESHEPSYYEVALTNRQVLIAFVVLLTSIVAAFLSGVWIGRGGGTVARNPASAPVAAVSATEAPLEQLTFFNGKDAGARGAAAVPGAPAGAPAPAGASSTAAAPAAGDKRGDAAPAESAAEENATEAMRRNLDATMAANRTVPAPATSPPAEKAPAPAGSRKSTKPEAPSAVPAKPVTASPSAPKENVAPKPAVAGKTYVQVYSSTNGTRAKEIVAKLKKAGFAVAVAETNKGGATSYRVRVGPYSERAKADSAAARLRREFRLETWVTDSP